MLRQGLLWLSQQNGIFRFVRSNPLARRFASRFVAGETIEEGVASARELMSRGITAWLDMEGSDYTQRTLDFFRQHLFPDFSAYCGVVIQSALRRSERDINDMIAMRARVRLCKGAYLEPPDVAFPEKADVDRNYVKLMERLLAEGNYPGLATHDEKIIAQARAFVGEQRIADDRFEFQMLYGVRRDLQQQLRAAGHRMRVYIPFGTQWYPYLMRRLAERPANIAFMMGNIVKESVKHR